MENQPTLTAWQRTLCLSKIISGTLKGHFEFIYDRVLDGLEEPWQRYLWLFTIIATTSIIIIPIIAIALMKNSIHFEYVGPSPSTATSRPDPSAEDSPTAEKIKIYTLPKPIRFMATPRELNDTSTLRHMGQLSEFVRLTDPWGTVFWIGLASYHRFSALYSDEFPDVLMGSNTYEVVIGQPVNQDEATSRVEVVPTGRALGKVVGAYVDNVTILLKMEDSFLESEMFQMGRWVEVVKEQVQAGDEDTITKMDNIHIFLEMEDSFLESEMFQMGEVGGCGE